MAEVSGLDRGGDDFSPWSAVRNYWWLVVVVTVVAGILGAAFASSQDAEYEATAGLIVEDPRASSLFEVTELGRPSTQASERYLADQVEILRSSEVANVASELLDGEVEPRAVLRNTSIDGDLTSNLIEVSFTADTPEGAQAAADAVANAYQEIRRRQVQDLAAVALAKVDALLAAIDADIAQIDAKIDAASAGSESLRELSRQFDQAQQQLNELRVQRSQLAVGSEQRLAINAQIDELLRDFSTWEVVLRISERGSELDNLLTEKDAAAAEKATLVSRANSIEVSAELAAGGVILFSNARLPESPNSISTDVSVVVGALVGLLFAFAVAYYLTLRRTAVASRTSPRALLNAPLLAEIPSFDLEGIASATPVVAAPTSSAAEAFRFAASLVDIRAAAIGARSFFVVSATPESGRTAFVANTGLAAAAAGLRILLVDADFANQDLTALLVRTTPAAGLTEVVDGDVALVDAVTKVTVGRDRSLAVLSRGHHRVDAANYLRSDKTQALFAALRDEFDLVLIDGPSLLQVAYASTLARYSDGVIVVVEHGSDVRELQELSDHLSLIDTSILGYVYTKSPTGHAMPDSETITAPPARQRNSLRRSPQAQPLVPERPVPAEPAPTAGQATKQASAVDSPWPTRSSGASRGDSSDRH